MSYIFAPYGSHAQKATGHGLPRLFGLLDRIDDHGTTLQAHSGPLLGFIEWRPTPDRNVEVLNDTTDLYRYFDCTGAAELLYARVQRTVEHDLPREVD